jgi:nitrite reductase (NO-forming)
MQARSLQQATWAVRWYYACAVFLAVGVVAGAALARGAAWEHGNLLGAHLALNLAGWFGTAIVGTLHTFYPSLTQTRLRLPRLQGPTFAAWVGGTAALAAGHAFDIRAVGLAGWCALTAAALLLTANMLLSARAAPVTLPLPARLVALGQLFLLAGLGVGLVKALGDEAALPPVTDARPVLATLLLAGWLGLTVLGSLVHLLAVLVRIGDLTRPFPEPRRLYERSVPVLAGVAVTALALARLVPVDELTAPAAGVLAAAYVLLAARILALAARALRQSPPRILAR